MTAVLRVPRQQVLRTWNQARALALALWWTAGWAAALGGLAFAAVGLPNLALQFVAALAAGIVGVVFVLSALRTLALLGVTGFLYQVRREGGSVLGTPRQLLLRRGLLVPDGSRLTVQITPDQHLEELDGWDVYFGVFRSYPMRGPSAP